MASSKPLSDSSDDEDETESMVRDRMRSNAAGNIFVFLHFILCNTKLTIFRIRWRHIKPVLGNLIQIFGSKQPCQEKLHQNNIEPVRSCHNIFSHLPNSWSAGLREPPWAWSSSTASPWAATSPAWTRLSATTNARYSRPLTMSYLPTLLRKW